MAEPFLNPPGGQGGISAPNENWLDWFARKFTGVDPANSPRPLQDAVMSLGMVPFPLKKPTSVRADAIPTMAARRTLRDIGEMSSEMGGAASSPHMGPYGFQQSNLSLVPTREMSPLELLSKMATMQEHAGINISPTELGIISNPLISPKMIRRHIDTTHRNPVALQNLMDVLSNPYR